MKKFTLIGRQGFTLIELLIVIAIIAVLAGVVFVAVNPLQRFRDARNAKRSQDIQTIAEAVRLYQLTNSGRLPTGIDETWKMIGTSTNGCNVDCSSITSGTSTSPSSGSITHNQQSDFNGTYTNTEWNISDSVLKLSSGTTGSYTSSILNLNTWTNFSYISKAPYGKELPNNKQVETGYSTGNMDMAGNVGLYHLNESDGVATFVDSSGSGNNGFCLTGKCPTMGVSGKLNTAGTFGVGKYVEIQKTINSNQFNGNSSFTLSAWIYPTTENPGVIIQDALGSSPYRGIWFMCGNYGGYARKIQSFLTDINGKAIWVQSPVSVLLNQWHLAVVTYDGSKNISGLKIYLDGVYSTESLGSNSSISDSLDNNNPWRIGSASGAVPSSFFNGTIDEVAIFNRVLSASEISNMYLRGVARLKFQVRSCSTANCSDASFAGSSGSGSYYEEGTNLTPPSFSLNNSSAKYFQYKAFLNSDFSSVSPKLSSFTLNYTQSGGDVSPTSSLQSSCLNLSPDLSKQLPIMPFDPSVGSLDKTYYAIKKETKNIIRVLSCSAEGGEVINVAR